jgi:hypothetical protein
LLVDITQMLPYITQLMPYKTKHVFWMTSKQHVLHDEALSACTNYMRRGLIAYAPANRLEAGSV